MTAIVNRPRAARLTILAILAQETDRRAAPHRDTLACMSATTDYVLGADEEEIECLGLQHASWRAHALAAWRTAGLGPRQIVLDVGCGPGYAAIELARLVGPGGRV